MPDSFEGDLLGRIIGMCSLTGLFFIAAKMLGLIEWSWMWVLAPFWLPFISLVILVMCLAIMVAITGEK